MGQPTPIERAGKPITVIDLEDKVINMENAEDVLKKAIELNTLGRRYCVEAVIEGGRALLVMKAEGVERDFTKRIEDAGMAYPTAARWMQAAKTDLEPDYIIETYGSITAMLADKDATSGRLAKALARIAYLQESIADRGRTIADTQEKINALCERMTPEQLAEHEAIKDMHTEIAANDKTIADWMVKYNDLQDAHRVTLKRLKALDAKEVA